MDGRHGFGGGFLFFNLGSRRSIGQAPFLEGLAGRIVGGNPAFLRGDEHGGVVGDTDLCKKLGGLGAGDDGGNPRLPTHVDFFEKLASV